MGVVENSRYDNPTNKNELNVMSPKVHHNEDLIELGYMSLMMSDYGDNRKDGSN